MPFSWCGSLLSDAVLERTFKVSAVTQTQWAQMTVNLGRAAEELRVWSCGDDLADFVS